MIYNVMHISISSLFKFNVIQIILYGAPNVVRKRFATLCTEYNYSTLCNDVCEFLPYCQIKVFFRPFLSVSARRQIYVTSKNVKEYLLRCGMTYDLGSSLQSVMARNISYFFPFKIPLFISCICILRFVRYFFRLLQPIALSTNDLFLSV